MDTFTIFIIGLGGLGWVAVTLLISELNRVNEINKRKEIDNRFDSLDLSHMRVLEDITRDLADWREEMNIRLRKIEIGHKKQITGKSK
jgi:hypothetical protein